MAGSEKVTPRREFMRSVGVGAAALAATAAGVRADAQPVQPVANSTFRAEPWLARLTGKHRQFFDAISPNDGWALVFAKNFIDMNMQAYEMKQSEVTAVLGLRHFAIPLALNDAMWSKYKLGAFFKVNDKSTNAPAVRNVFSHVKQGDMPFAGAALDELIARGMIVTACEVALTVLSGMTAGVAGLPTADAKREWMSNLIPGVVTVPAGVLAVNRAQENHCTYCFAG